MQEIGNGQGHLEYLEEQMIQPGREMDNRVWKGMCGFKLDALRRKEGDGWMDGCV